MAPRVFKGFFLNVIFCLVAAQSIKYGLKGQEVKLKPQIQEQQPDLILWMHNGMAVVEFNGKEEDVYDLLKHRTTLDWHSAELHLTDLRSEDSGLYELQLYMQKKPYSYYYTLQVIDKVAKPTITCETNSSKTSNLSGLLTCSAPQPDIEYEWFFYGNTQPGPQLRIFLDNKHDERVYSCRVSNPLSNETAEFTAKDCYSDESSPVVLAAVLPAVVLLLPLLLVLVAGVVIYRRCYKGWDNETAEDGESQLPLKSHIKGKAAEYRSDILKDFISMVYFCLMMHKTLNSKLRTQSSLQEQLLTLIIV
uniref:Ig-like domain-containing protein n=1 Tax=Takifugu rubripes TaxID=31033 RepID=A0A674MMI1_TAKRU